MVANIDADAINDAATDCPEIISVLGRVELERKLLDRLGGDFKEQHRPTYSASTS